MEASSALSGKRILVTRAKEQAGALSRLIEQAGGTSIELPLLRFELPEKIGKAEFTVNDLEHYDWIVFTSVNGVRFFQMLLERHHRVLQKQIKIAAVGSKTKRAIEQLGYQVDVFPDEFVAESLATTLINHTVTGQRILLARGNLSRSVLPEMLKQAGLEVTDLVVYETKCNDAVKESLTSVIKTKSVDVITFTSSSTVTYFAEMIGAPDLKRELEGIIVACIGPIAAETARSLGLEPEVVPDVYTANGLVQAIIDYFQSK